MFSTLVTFAALMTAATADPAVIISNGLLSPPFTSAAIVAPASAPLVAPVTSVSLPTVGSLAVPYTSVSDYRYSYGSSLSYQDYAPVSAAITLPYNLPYAYAADWYYRNV